MTEITRVLLSLLAINGCSVDAFQAPRGPLSWNTRLGAIPGLDQWKIIPGGKLSGKISGHPVIPDGDTITTAPLQNLDGIKSQDIVETSTGSKFTLLDPAVGTVTQPVRGTQVIRKSLDAFARGTRKIVDATYRATQAVGTRKIIDTKNPTMSTASRGTQVVKGTRSTGDSGTPGIRGTRVIKKSLDDPAKGTRKIIDDDSFYTNSPSPVGRRTQAVRGTQVIKESPNAPLRGTQVIRISPEAPTRQTQVIKRSPDATISQADSENQIFRGTQVIKRTPDAPVRGTQVIKKSPDARIRGTEVIKKSPDVTIDKADSRTQAVRGTQVIKESPDAPTRGTQVIKPTSDAPVKGTQVIKKSTEATTAKENSGTQAVRGTQVVEPPNVPVSGTQVIKKSPDASTRGTQVIKAGSDAPFRGTQVISKSPDAAVNQAFSGTQVIRNSPGASFSGTRKVIGTRPLKTSTTLEPPRPNTMVSSFFLYTINILIRSCVLTLLEYLFMAASGFWWRISCGRLGFWFEPGLY